MNIESIVKKIGFEYRNMDILPDENSNYIKYAFDIITQVNNHLFNQIPFEVIFTTDDVYASAKEMRERVIAEKKIYIYTISSGHPVLSVDDNNKGRAVHDVYAHLVCGCPFTFQGEYNAYLTQAKYYPDNIMPVLFAEIPAQTAAYYYHKSFDYKQRAFSAPFEWMTLCNGLERDYSMNSVMQPFEHLYK